MKLLMDLSRLTLGLSETKEKVDILESCASDSSARLSEIEKEQLPKLQDGIRKVREEMEEKCLLLEIHDRKSNLLLYGVQHSPNEDIYQKASEVFSGFLGISVDVYKHFK